jgi:hypothetical protein
MASLLGFATNTALAWGHKGHEVVGAIADPLLTPNAASKVKQFTGMTLRNAAKWADCVRDVKPKDGKFIYQPDPKYHVQCMAYEEGDGIARMEDYIARNWNKCTPSRNPQPCPDQFHYADVAIQHTKYDRAFAGTSDHDIVGSVKAAIAFLLKKPVPSSFHIKDEMEALLLLAHFVGDIHQPLHVGAVYLDDKGRLINPDDAGKKLDPKTETHGGNRIEDDFTNLHTEWDSVPSSITPDAISGALLARAKAVKKTTGDSLSWSAAWATESLRVSQVAFNGITFKSNPEKPGRWIANIKDRKAYNTAKNNLQTEQLAKAGARLAQILNAIWP